MLAAKDEVGTPALYIAITEGSEDAIEAYGQFVLEAAKWIPINELLEILAAIDTQGTALSMALTNGD